MLVREGHTGRGNLPPVRATTQTKPNPPPPPPPGTACGRQGPAIASTPPAIQHGTRHECYDPNSGQEAAPSGDQARNPKTTGRPFARWGEVREQRTGDGTVRATSLCDCQRLGTTAGHRGKCCADWGEQQQGHRSSPPVRKHGCCVMQRARQPCPRILCTTAEAIRAPEHPKATRTSPLMTLALRPLSSWKMDPIFLGGEAAGGGGGSKVFG